jgi:alkylation response protein AidB-like acyl-CoA dehydrogenase
VNLALSDEQGLLREAARGALSRVGTVAAARAALEGEELPDLWSTASEVGWPGMLISEDAGGAGLGAFDAMLVMGECGRVLASVPLLGHLPATALLDAAGAPGREELASGQRRAAYLPTRPPDDLGGEWTVDAHAGKRRSPAPRLQDRGAGEQARVTGEVAWVPDAPGADILVGAAIGEDGQPVGVAIESGAPGVTVEPVTRYDATRALGQVHLESALASVLGIGAPELSSAWFLAQALIAAESLGAVETALEMSVTYAKERYTFGRAIGSYQAVKHALTEVLRQLENGRSLLYYAGWAREGAPAEFALAASAARSAAGRALDFAARELISVHGGIGATWEHDAPLYFRRAQLSRLLLGGTGDASERVAGELMLAADRAGPATAAVPDAAGAPA